MTRGQRRRYAAATAALVLAASFLYLVPLVPQVILDGVLTADGEKASGFARRAVEVAGGRDFLRAHLWIAAVMIALLTAVAGLFTYLRGRWAAKASEHIVRRLRDELYDHLQRLPVAEHDRVETGDLVQRCTSDVDTVRMFLANQVVEIGRAMLMLVLPLPLMLALDVRMTLVSMALVPPIVLFSFFYFKRVQVHFLRVDEAEAAMTSTLQENLTGIRVVRAFARQEYEREKFAVRNATHRGMHYVFYRLLAWYWSLSDFMCMSQKLLVVGVGGYWLLVGQLPVGTFYFFLAAVNLFIWPIRMMGRILSEFGKALVAAGRIGEILDTPRERDPEDAGCESGEAVAVEAAPLDDPGPIRAPAAGMPRLVPSDGPAVGAIDFDHVGFAYGDGRRVLHDVCFRVAAGETLALLGPSGAGKSTLISLLLRFYDPVEGSIRLDGRDIATIGRQDMRSEIAVVMQEPFLYSKTVRENIRLGRSSARDEEIQEAATIACVHESIEGFDQGYDTLVGERGVTLSGGQRQRVALARALLHEPVIMILDDALSAVDTVTENLIIDALRQRRGRHTTLVIAHRLSTLMHADRVLVLDRGHVVQQGTHATLVEEEGLYRRLWRIQGAIEADLDDGPQAAAR
ncbi:MAG: ABC transporter ATP-binding protein [Candidatus Eiseniibacteriota bacterium]|jgi:ATP-binding cassette subfamily B protein